MLISAFLFHVLTLNLLSNAYGQQLSVSGTVKSPDNKPLEGVTVEIPGAANTRTSTNEQGYFSISNITKGARLLFSSVGYQQLEVTVKDASALNIVLELQQVALEKVVVTALGIKCEEKKLAYAQQTIKAEDFSTAVANNWSSGLMGKVAGLCIISWGTGPINSQKIQLRGTSSLNLSVNNAVIVVDGVPMNQETIAYGNNVGAAYWTKAQVDYGNHQSGVCPERALGRCWNAL